MTSRSGFSRSSLFCIAAIIAAVGAVTSPASGETTPPWPPAAKGVTVNRPVSIPQGISGTETVKADLGNDGAPRGGAAVDAAPQPEPSALEQAVSASEKSMDKPQPQPPTATNLVQFGYNFFRSASPGFAPVSDAPVGGDYVIGPGDRLIVNLWGSIDASQELEVNRSGEIFLPKIGTVKVWGVSFANLPGVLRARVAKLYRDFDLSVTMGKLRLIKVFVVGDVKAPGDYSLSPLSTLINALSAAGGPLKTGTLRNVQVKRGGSVVETVDLYDFFLKGDKSRDIRLQPGDTIFVPVIGSVASIAGTVKRPAIYELKGEKNLADLVDLAGGFLPTGYLQRLQVSRVEAHAKKVVSDFNVDPQGEGKTVAAVLQGIAIQDMDVVKVFPIDTTLRDHVRVTGHVLRPGDYALRPGMRLGTLLPPENLLPEYYRDAVEVTRLVPPDYHPEMMFVNLGKALAGDPAHDLELREFDRIKVYSRWEMEEMPKVRVNGEVQRPGEYRLFERMTVRELLLQAGGTKNTAFLKRAEINRLNRTGESASSYPVSVNLEEALRGNPEHNLALLPFDELSVRRIPNWSDETERYITLQGEVRFPGIYPVYRGEKLSAVIERAGGFTQKAYLRGAKLTRKSVQEEQQKRMEEVIARTEQDIARKQSELASVASSKEELDATKASLEALLKGLEKLKTVKAEGRMVIRVERLEIFRNSRYDMEVMGGDTLQIPARPNSVHIIGQVYNPATVLHIDGKKLSYYLNKAGGPTRDADEGAMYVIKADGSVVSNQQSSFGFHWNDDSETWNYGSFRSTRLEPGDAVVVPQRLERVAWLRDIKDITTIISQVALTAGVLIAAGL